MLYSVATQTVGWPYQETEFEGLNLHQWLFYSSIPYFVVHEDAIADTREILGDYRVIVAPFATVTRRELGRTWLNWIRVGGVLLSSGPFGVYDEFGKEDLTVLRAVFGAGLKVAAECDLRICTPEALFASPQAKVGRATESPLYLRKAGVPSAVVMDMVYKPLKTPFLAQAEALGLATVDGLEMLIRQAVPSFEAFFGQSPPADVDVRRDRKSVV